MTSHNISNGIIFYIKTTGRSRMQWRTEGGFGGGFNPPPTPATEIPKVLQNRAKLNPIVKTVKNC